jgi:hypothetical protein
MIFSDIMGKHISRQIKIISIRYFTSDDHSNQFRSCMCTNKYNNMMSDYILFFAQYARTGNKLLKLNFAM